jgi:heme/copper-type cytochrome/quinol oxidase subunit 2
MALAILWSCALVATVTVGVMIHSIATFRAELGAAPASYRPCSIVEVIWALVPIAIFIGAALPAVKMIGAVDAQVAEATK